MFARCLTWRPTAASRRDLPLVSDILSQLFIVFCGPAALGDGIELLSFNNSKHRHSVIPEMSGDSHDRMEIGQFSPTMNAS